MTIRQWIKTPKGNVALAMTAYLLIVSAWSQDTKGIIHALVAVVAALAVDIICCLIERRKRIMPDGAVITGLIIALILSVSTSLPIVASTAAMAILSKHLIVHRKRPVFNPAVFGLLLSIPLFHTEQSWWGAFGDLPAWSAVLLLVGGYIIVNRVNKFPQIFAFFGVYFVMLLLMGLYNVGDAADALRTPFVNATLFFGFFMLTDLPTSPIKVKDQIVFGILTALSGVVIYGLYGGLMYLFIGLLLGNLYHYIRTLKSAHASKEFRPKRKKTNKIQRHSI